MNNSEMTNIGSGERVLRTAVTMGLIALVLSANGTLGYMTLLALFAIYTGITALTGWDPVDSLINSIKQSATNSSVDNGQTH